MERGCFVSPADAATAAPGTRVPYTASPAERLAGVDADTDSAGVAAAASADEDTATGAASEETAAAMASAFSQAAPLFPNSACTVAGATSAEPATRIP